MHPLLDLNATAGVMDEPTKDVAVWRDGPDCLHARDAGLLGYTSGVAANLRQVVRIFSRRRSVFLKQFPDSSGHRAVYQAIVAAPAKVKEIRKLALLTGRYDLRLHAFDSFPLHHTLGWIIGEQQAHCGFRIDFDFEVGDGIELVDNSAGKENR